MKIESNDVPDYDEFIPQVTKRIFHICKTDHNFSLRKDLESLSGEFEELQEKIDKKNDMLNQSNYVKKELLNRIKILERDNDNLKSELLSELGSDE
jgi:hypothetical protein